MTSPPLVLASESPYRRELLDRLHISYQAHAHRFDERGLAIESSLEQHAVALAVAKAESLAALFPKAVIVASDQIAELQGQVLHKPGSIENARHQLAQMQGRTHRLLTAVVVRSPDGSVQSSLDVHRMHMRGLDADEIDRYLALDTPLDCCGSYKIECAGIALFDRIEGDDFTAIMGLPLLALGRMLRSLGYQVP